MTPALAYLRVSGPDQIERDGFTRQLKAIEAYAVANGYQIIEVYREEGVSGSTEQSNRVAWQAMIADFRASVIIIEKLDRLARDLMLQESIISECIKFKRLLISTCEPDLLSTDPSRVVIRQIMGSIAQYDKAQIVHRLTSARRRIKAQTGRMPGGKTPFGLKPGEEPILAKILILGSAGTRPVDIARQLNADGLKPRKAASWHHYGISSILAAHDVRQIRKHPSK